MAGFKEGFLEGILFGIMIKFGTDISEFGIGATVINALPLNTLPLLPQVLIRGLLIVIPIILTWKQIEELLSNPFFLIGYIIGFLLILLS